MRRKQRSQHKKSRHVLLNALSVASHVAAIIGTILTVIDLIHHW